MSVSKDNKVAIKGSAEGRRIGRRQGEVRRGETKGVIERSWNPEKPSESDERDGGGGSFPGHQIERRSRNFRRRQFMLGSGPFSKNSSTGTPEAFQYPLVCRSAEREGMIQQADSRPF